MEQHKKTKTEEIHEGLNYIMIFLEEVNQFTKQNSPFYKIPQFIYRGITTFYTYDNPKPCLHPDVDKVKSGCIRSALSVRLSRTRDSYSQLDIIAVR